MKTCLVLACLIATICGQAATSFMASVTITNDPGVIGTMLGTMYYDSTQGIMRTDYQIGSGIVTEFINYPKQIRYLYCTTCESMSYTQQMPQYQGGTLVAGDTISVNGMTCNHYTVSGNVVTDIWASGTTICRAQWGNGMVVNFANVAANPSTAFTVINGWNCPTPVCNKEIDFVLVMDESGSISPPNFVKEVQFCTAFANSYAFGPNSVGMALVQFSTYARLTIHMTYSQTSFLNAMAAVYQNPGNTCIGCGLQLAYDEFINYGRWKQPGVADVIIMLTDGMNNIGLDQFASIVSTVKGAGMIIFSLGVGSLVNPPELEALATPIAGVQTAYPTIPSFSSLEGVLNGLVTATCQATPGTPCGTGCNGFCSCGGTCVCPSSCNDNNMCTTKSCTAGINGNGCVYTTKPCSNGNLCQSGTCSPATGCAYTNITCTASDICHVAGCSPSVGCTNMPLNCNLGNPCYADSCSVSMGGCQHVKLPPGSCNMCINVTCPQIPCMNNECNPNTGLCVATPIDCNDNNMCTNKSCNVATGMCEYTLIDCNNGNNCQLHSCDPTMGCVQTDVNVTSYCNDYSVCTLDTCEPATGCVHTNITCNDNNNCTADMCNSITGCYYPPVDCLSIPRIARLIGTCYEALCNNSRGGCYLQPLPGAVIDSCGVCNGNNACAVVQLPSTVPYVVAGGLLAVVIIGAIIAGVAILSFAGKKGYDIWLAHKGGVQGASNNPLYNDGGLTGVNPTYTA